MPIDPKNLRLPSVKLPKVDGLKDLKQPITPKTITPPALLPKVNPKIGDGSHFEPSNIRRTGVPDDSVGRATGKGKPKGKGKGVPDDSVGVSERDDLFAPHETDDQLALRAAVFQRLETPSYLDEPSPARPFKNQKQVEAGLTAATNATQAKALFALAKSNPEVGARLENLFTSTSGLRHDVAHSILQTFAAAPAGVEGSVVEHIVTSGYFQKLSVAGQTELASVMSKLDKAGLTYLGALVEKAPKALSDKDSQGHTLLSSLAKLASQPLNTKLARKTTTEALLSSLVRDIANPNRVDQGTAPTCTVTSMQFEMVADNPAEYVRLMTGLVGPSGSARMRGGSALKLGPTDGDAAARDGRSVSQAIFQSCAMEYANGRFSEFDPVAGKSTHAKTGATFRGLKPDMQQAVLEQLFGVKYSTNQLKTEAEGQAVLEKLRGFNSRKTPNRPVILDIDQGNINHAVTLERVANARVYFRDPYGSLRSMDESMFARYVVAVHSPK